MKYHIEVSDPGQLGNIEAALKIVDHNAELSNGDTADLRIIVQTSDAFTVKVTAPDLPETENSWEISDEEILDSRYNQDDRKQRVKELVRLGIIQVVGCFLHVKPPWGILSGVRPTKIFHYYRDKGFSVNEIRDRLTMVYGLAESKAELLIEVGSRQERFFKPGRIASIYIGIPFCPSRCRYCSFSAVPLSTHGHLVNAFIHTLLEEIEATVTLLRENGFAVESIYMGGGTPTSIDDQAFLAVVRSLVDKFKPLSLDPGRLDFTVEAGRPETVTEEKLSVMDDFEITRVSVNPQTMKLETLNLIGRQHSVNQIIEAVSLVKKHPRLALNMDLILGLPGETGEDFRDSLSAVIDLAPQNITVHTLAPKRASAWRKEFNNLELPPENELRGISEETISRLRSEHFSPYYMYRQRFILADLENVGFTKPGFENIYNIQMMEERQTIFGLGGGAVTKWVVGTDYTVYRYQNPKCPATYCQRIKESIVKKAQQTRLLLG